MKEKSNLCQCGCGETVAFNRRFINLHQNRGINHPNYKGGERIYKGYVFVLSPNHPRKNPRNYVRRSWLVMEQYLCRYLLPGEIIHHKNHIKTDDELENLQITNGSQHAKCHNSGKGNPAYRHDISTAAIQDLVKKGNSVFDISKTLYCSVSTVRRRLFRPGQA